MNQIPPAAVEQAAGVLPEVTDQQMQQLLGESRPYTAMLLRLTEKGRQPEAEEIIWEHGRRNMALRTAGQMPIICPATDESDWAGIAVFDASVAEVDAIMRDDPGVQSGVFTYELHPVFGFPGSTLPHGPASP
jgi:hypothetical protein